MLGCSQTTGRTRRAILKSAGRQCVVAAIATLVPRLGLSAPDDEIDLVERLLGRMPTESARLRLAIPPVFANGYTVPLALELDSPMTEADHVRHFHILAPKNPIIAVASFHFTPRSGRARVSTRIRLAEPQNVVAAAELSDGTLLMARAWVKVDSNGCA